MMGRGDFIKFNGKNPEYWGIDSEKEYIVQDFKYKDNQRFVRLYNKKHKLRWYYEHLFIKIKKHNKHWKYSTHILKVYKEMQKNAPDDDDLLLKWELAQWHEARFESGEGTKFFTPAIYERSVDILNILNENFKKAEFFKKGTKVKFIGGHFAEKFKDRIFRCIQENHSSSYLCASVKLAGLCGFHDSSLLEIV